MKFFNKGMRNKILLIASLFFITLPAFAFMGQAGDHDPLIRFNYKKNGLVYIGTEKIFISSGKSDKAPFYMDLRLVGFPDGTDAFLLKFNFEQDHNIDIPKGAKLTFTTNKGKMISAEQLAGPDAENKGFETNDGIKYWNTAVYIFELPNLEKLMSGISHLDLSTGWGPDDYIAVDFPKNEFSEALTKEYSSIIAQKRAEEEVGEHIADYKDSNISTTIVAAPSLIKSDRMDMRAALMYMYSKRSNKEMYDLNVVLEPKKEEKYTILLGMPVVFTLENGEQISLKQEKDDINALHCYPTANQIKMFSEGVKSVAFHTSAGLVNVDFDDDEFGIQIIKQYNSLQMFSVL